MNKFGALLELIECYELISLADKVYGPYENPLTQRSIVIIKDDKGNKRTVSWPKYIMEQHLGRVLDQNAETIDHVDRNHLNNDINNLRIVPRAQHSKDDTRRVKNIKLNCDMCKKEFERSPRLIRDKSKKGARGIFCSKSCASKHSRLRQLNRVEELPVQPYIESEYYRNIKNLASLKLSSFVSLATAVSLEEQLTSLKPELALAAQQVIDEWEQDEDGMNPELGSGGICDRVSEAMMNVLSNINAEMMDGGQDGDDHAYLVIHNDTEAFAVDIPPGVYETGAGYSWKKIPNAKITSDDVVIDPIDRRLIEDSSYDF